MLAYPPVSPAFSWQADAFELAAHRGGLGERCDDAQAPSAEAAVNDRLHVAPIQTALGETKPHQFFLRLVQ